MHCSLSRRSLHASSQTHQVDSSTLSCLCFICPFACLKQSFASYISYNYRRNEKEMAANSVFHTLCIYLYYHWCALIPTAVHATATAMYSPPLLFYRRSTTAMTLHERESVAANELTK